MFVPPLQLSATEIGVSYALLIAMVLGGSVILDRLILKSSVVESIGAITILAIGTSTLIALPISVVVFDVSFRLTAIQYIAVVLAGVFKTIPLVLYYRAIRSEESTIVSPITSGSHIVVVILAFLLLGEQLSLFQYLGVGMIIFGTILLSTQQSSESFRVNYAALLAIAATFLFGIKAITYKYALIVTDSVGTAIFFIHVFGLLVALIGLGWEDVREEIVSILSLNQEGISFEAFSQTVTGITSVLRIVSYSLIPVSIAAPLTGTLPAFTFLYVVILSLLGIQVESKMTQRDFIYKFLSTSFVVIGILIIVL